MITTVSLDETCDVKCTILGSPELDAIGLTLEQKIPGDEEAESSVSLVITKQIASDICNAVQKCLNELAAGQ